MLNETLSSMGACSILVVGLVLLGCQFDDLGLQRCDVDADCGERQRCQHNACVEIAIGADVTPPDATNCGASVCYGAELCCDGECVDPAVNRAHCGACGNACPDTSTCRDGACECETGRGDCDNDLTNGCETDLTIDRDHCGECGQTCPAALNKECLLGGCVCAAGFADCDGDPANGCEAELLRDTENCGSCSASCPELPSCHDGQCSCGTERCNADQTCCTDGDPTCANTDASPLNCGGCGQNCKTGETCVSGECRCGTGPGCTSQDICCGGVCRPPGADECMCGAGGPCGPGEACCDETCVDLTTDENNCGACGNICDPGSECLDGACGCQGDAELCGDQCVDTNTSGAHCGGCDNACASGESCCGGICVDTQGSESHCGACLADGGSSCGDNETCCGGTCNRGGEEPTRCGPCGVDCTVGLSNARDIFCNENGECDFESCASGFADCDGDPANGCETDLNSDDNCGECGLACGDNGTCSNRRCECDTGGACALGATCDRTGQCKCGGNGGNICRFPKDGDHCSDSDECRCGEKGHCQGANTICTDGDCENPGGN